MAEVNVFSNMDGSKLDLSGINVSDFDSQARLDIMAKLNSAIFQVQSFAQV